MYQQWMEVSRQGSRQGIVRDAGDLELDAPLSGQPA